MQNLRLLVLLGSTLATASAVADRSAPPARGEKEPAAATAAAAPGLHHPAETASLTKPAAVAFLKVGSPGTELEFAL